MPRSSFRTQLSRVDLRFVAGVLCVVVAAGVLIERWPTAFRGFNTAVKYDSWRPPIRRLVHTGDVNGIPHDFQEAALAYVPPRSTFAVLPPTSVESAAKYYGIPAVALDAVDPYFQFLLLPSRLVAPEDAQYVLCFACDTSPWDARTTWIWKNTNGDGVGRVNAR
jgi:hypothetical protein